nr:hypothetical protein [Xanthomonas sacchari]
MPNYAIEARSLGVIGIAGHAFWVLRDEHGKAVAELHGLATDRQTGQAIPIGTDATRHSLRAWHYPHDPAYARSISEKVDSTTYIRDDQPSRTVATGDKHEILERWNTAMHAVPELNAQDRDYPNYGFKVFGKTVNSNSAYRTFGELMDVPVWGFPGRLEPGIGNRMLSPERTEELRYHAPGEQKQQRAPAPRGRSHAHRPSRSHAAAADPRQGPRPQRTWPVETGRQRPRQRQPVRPGQATPLQQRRPGRAQPADRNRCPWRSIFIAQVSCQRSNQAACAYVNTAAHKG